MAKLEETVLVVAGENIYLPDILELDEMCVSYKKICLWTALSRKTKNLVGFFVVDRSSKSFEKLCKNISHIDAKFYATDKYTILFHQINISLESLTLILSERMNRLLSHYLARFSRKTCWSKSFDMINNSVFLFLHGGSLSSSHF